jgi:hypothetical protein
MNLRKAERRNCYELLIICLAGLILLANGLIARDREEWRDKMQPLVQNNYLCRFTTKPIEIDGQLNDPAWANAKWTTDFVDIQGPSKTKPKFRTRAKLLWDEEYLYVSAELEEPHIWGTLTNHDAVIFQDPDFEVFLDPDGNTHQYYELEINALNTTWDLKLDKPYRDRGNARNDWEFSGLKTAVHINGTLNNSTDIDTAWSVEIALPWNALTKHTRHAGPPTEGEQWHLNFSRVQWQIVTNNAKYEKVKGKSEDNWVWSPQGVVDMHRPEMWGLLQFTKQESADIAVAPLAGKPARDLALEVYHAQRDFKNSNRRWATNVSELGLDMSKLPTGVDTPVIKSSSDGYVCAVTFKDGDRQRVWRIRQDRLLKLDEEIRSELEIFVTKAGEKHGDAGRRAAWFLVDNMPARDRDTLTAEFLLENVSLALEARNKFPWAKAIPEAIFLNDVLPYASIDEPRDPWRAEFFRLGSEIVRDCKTATEAAQALNRDLFKRINVHYNTGRRRTNQSPKESIEQGKATCTGLAIILADACRAVGVPARVAGVPDWVDKDGNHTWTEIWDGEWYFTGADEYDKNGLNRGWFNGDAARTARSTNAIHQIYATSWRQTGQHFPLAWNRNSREIPGINVSARYAALARDDANSSAPVVHVRLRERENGNRIAADVELRSSAGLVIARERTRAGTADLNDMPGFKIPKDEATLYLRFISKNEAREKVLSSASCANTHTLDVVWSDLPPVPSSVVKAEAWLAHPQKERGEAPDVTFTSAETTRLSGLAWHDLKKRRAESAKDELSAKKVTVDGQELIWMEKVFGDAPAGKRSLWITMHGGGQARPVDNDRGWKGYYGRYEFPAGSINVAPRAPANSWNMWHVAHVDGLFDRLIADMVLERGVDPNRVYLIGYSAGGDGVYQLSPRMCDRFAAAAMCAGHPNDASPEPLRNLPFYLYMGGDDSAYNRNKVVVEFGQRLDVLQAADPEGYIHRVTVFPGLPHNMMHREAEMIPHMAAKERLTWPKRVVWKHDDNPAHSRLYWLKRAPEGTRSGEVYAARAQGQTISIEKPQSGSLILRLSDSLLNLDEPVRVVVGERTIFEGKVQRSFAAIVNSLSEREDPNGIATALLPVTW